MSGHSKWSTIRHKKAIVDSKRSAVFTKIAKKIQIAAKQGNSGNPDLNATLRTILDEARSVNMPNDNIKKAIDKGLGVGGEQVIEIVYEGYGPGGIGIMITCATDNRNRTGTEIRTLLEKHGGSLAGPGAVSYMLAMHPVPTLKLDEDTRAKAIELLDLLDDHDDVMDLWTNLEHSDDQTS